MESTIIITCSSSLYNDKKNSEALIDNIYRYDEIYYEHAILRYIIEDCGSPADVIHAQRTIKGEETADQSLACRASESAAG